jgi:hypothetical protein
MFKTVKNDSRLFLAARSAGLVRIRVQNLEDELERVEWEGVSIDSSLWWSMGTAGNDVWCDTCLEPMGAKPSYGENLFPFPWNH